LHLHYVSSLGETVRHALTLDIVPNPNPNTDPILNPTANLNPIPNPNSMPNPNRNRCYVLIRGLKLIWGRGPHYRISVSRRAAPFLLMTKCLIITNDKTIMVT